MLTVLVATMTLATMSAPAQAADVPPSAPTPVVPSSDKKVCRSEQTLGSFLAKRVCRTARQWAEIDAGNSEAAEGALARRRSGVPGRN